MDRRREGRTLGRKAQRSAACRKSEGGNPSGSDRKGDGDHRRAGRRQDDDRQFDPQDSRGERRAAVALRAHRPRGEADDRGDGGRGQDDPSAARDRSQERRVHAQRRQSPRLRSARGRRRSGRSGAGRRKSSMQLMAHSRASGGLMVEMLQTGRRPSPRSRPCRTFSADRACAGRASFQPSATVESSFAVPGPRPRRSSTNTGNKDRSELVDFVHSSGIPALRRPSYIRSWAST